MDKKTIKLKNTTLNIYPRSAWDALMIEQISKNKIEVSTAGMYLHIIHTSLRRNLEQIPWYRLLKRLSIYRLTRISSLVNLLSIPQMTEIVNIIKEIETFSLEDNNG